jgi:hypothetical protein
MPEKGQKADFHGMLDLGGVKRKFARLSGVDRNVRFFSETSPVDAVPRGLAFRMTQRCLVANCFNGNNGDEEKPRTTFKWALTPDKASRLA